MSKKARIAHLAGPNATIQNTPPLVTSNKARAKHELPLLDGTIDALRAQRLAAPAKVYVEQFSAHPLEADAADLYGPPDGYLGTDGTFHKDRQSASDRAVYEIELSPEDGLYPLPYMAVQADGSAWEEECATPGGGEETARQGFFPDGSRSFEEIDRLGIDVHGHAGSISALADVAFFRGLPPSGYKKGLAADQRPDNDDSDIGPEVRGRDFYPYKPYHLASSPTRPTLAKFTNDMQALAASDDYDGVMFTQGSPQVEETAYWFSLLIDTTRPICGNAAQRPQGMISNDGPKNIVDSVNFISSGIWADDDGNNKCGVVVIQEQQIFAAREVAKVDARPGGYRATGGHGGIIGNVSHAGRLALTYLPAYKHTHLSAVNINRLPDTSSAVQMTESGIARVDIAVKDANGKLRGDAIPVVSITKDGSYSGLEVGDDPTLELDLAASVEHKLAMGCLAGFVVEGLVPYGAVPSVARARVLFKGICSGLPVAKVGRGAPEGFADPDPYQIAAANLTGTKARMLLMAAMLKLGSLPAAKDPDHPTADELAAIRAAVAAYQEIFDAH